MCWQLHLFPKVLKARGRRASCHDWVDDPQRPFTPPRPRPSHPVTLRTPASDGEESDESPDSAGAAPELGRADSRRRPGNSPSSAVMAAPAVVVSLQPSSAEGGDGISDEGGEVDAIGTHVGELMADMLFS